MKRMITVFAIALILSLAVPAGLYAVPPQEYDFFTGGGRSDYAPSLPAPNDHIDFMAELTAICQFLDQYQVKESEDPEFGGMIEDEYRTGDDRIVQTDNTQESIFVWSRYHELTGAVTFDQNVTDAWTYCQAFPAWEEEGTSEYYRVWNCGWGLRCTMQYSQTYDDDTYTSYAETCANYIIDHADDLPFEASPPGVGIRNALTLSWSTWNLFAYANLTSNETYRMHAQDYAARVKTWIEADSEHLNKIAWALSGGVAASCVLDVLFHDDPAGAIAWFESHLLQMNTYYNPEDYNPESWIMAWNSWQALAQNALWRTTHLFPHRRTTFLQSDHIRSFDTDADGGVPAHPDKPDTEDETWVSTYIVLMGFGKIEAPPDLRLTMNSTQIHAGDAMETNLQIYGPGLDETIDLYILLEIAGQFLFYPSFTTDPTSIPLPVPLDFDLAEWIGLTDWVPIFSISAWPDGVPPSDFTWWAGMTRTGTADLIGDIVSLTWSCL